MIMSMNIIRIKTFQLKSLHLITNLKEITLQISNYLILVTFVFIFQNSWKTTTLHKLSIQAIIKEEQDFIQFGHCKKTHDSWQQSI